MKLFKNWESRKKLKSVRDLYKQKYLDECEYSASLKQEADDADSNARQLKEENDKLRDENKRLDDENKKLNDENLAKKNIISEERRKSKKKIEGMQKRIDKLENESKTKKDSGRKENDLPFDKYHS